MNEPKTELTDALAQAEGYLLQGQAETAAEQLRRLAEDAEEYADKNCAATNEVQWFSFPTAFEKLAYRRIEGDPRELRDVGEPLDRLYNDLALAAVHAGDYDEAKAALKSAVRWNPMDCAARLNLADLYKVGGNMDEYLGLSFSVFERASDPRHLVRAFVNFSAWFQVSEKPRVAAACLRAAQLLDVSDSALDAAVDQAAGTDRDPAGVSDSEVRGLLADEGLPCGANPEVAACLLICASNAVRAGEKNDAAGFTLRARDLVGEPAAMGLLRAIQAAEAEELAGASGADVALDAEDAARSVN
ncbi:tetratricopeptide repeat protein [Paratractidigestivibacter sp.]|uniref:tetratricopeptide repeat protein n=1 Tax=Paratractidigestivibacter sp. TaxID=2847316 RepID=UPI002AC94FDB|nr:tetratricopeptide repeat protein [Paratractidigestivibacter sp.]